MKASAAKNVFFVPVYRTQGIVDRTRISYIRGAVTVFGNFNLSMIVAVAQAFAFIQGFSFRLGNFENRYKHTGPADGNIALSRPVFLTSLVKFEAVTWQETRSNKCCRRHSLAQPTGVQIRPVGRVSVGTQIAPDIKLTCNQNLRPSCECKKSADTQETKRSALLGRTMRMAAFAKSGRTKGIKFAKPTVRNRPQPDV